MTLPVAKLVCCHGASSMNSSEAIITAISKRVDQRM